MKWTQPQGYLRIESCSDLSDNKEAPREYTNTGLILTNLQTFSNRIYNARNALGMSVPREISAKPQLKEINSIVHAVSKEQLTSIAGDLGSIKKDYFLSDNWLLPLLIAVITNVLIIPKDESIRLRVSGTSSLAEALSNLENHNRPIPPEYPIIYPIYNVSVRELKKFIDNNSTQIKEAMNVLPNKPSFGKTGDKTLLVGLWSWYLINDSKSLTHQKIAKMINFQLKLSGEEIITNLDVGKALNKFQKKLHQYEI